MTIGWGEGVFVDPREYITDKITYSETKNIPFEAKGEGKSRRKRYLISIHLLGNFHSNWIQNYSDWLDRRTAIRCIRSTTWWYWY